MQRQHPAAPSPITPLMPMLGASLLSAFGSLPLHVAPIVTMVMISDSRLSIAGAGWVMSLAQAGEMIVALALPMLGVLELGRGSACVIAAAMMAGLFMAISQDVPVFLAGWFIIGAAAGGLKYLGLMAATRAAQLTFAFSLRLSMILLVAGVAGLLFCRAEFISSYAALLQQAMIVFAAGLLVGLALIPHRHLASPQHSKRRLQDSDQFGHSISEFSGLAVVFLFFASLSGVIVFALHQAVHHGVATTDAVWMLALAKLVAGVSLIVTCGISARRDRQQGGLLPFSLLLALGTVVIFLSSDKLMLFAGLLTWEIAVNNLSARLQAAVVRHAPQLAGKWLSLAILLGIATGPSVNGFLISYGVGYVYVAFAALVPLVLPLWHRWVGNGPTGVMRAPHSFARGS